MGWGNCGEDSRGRPIGYFHTARCDDPSCGTQIHRGLSYVCGGMHLSDEWSCEGYFCDEHRRDCLPIGGRPQAVCAKCYAEARAWAISHPDDSRELIEHFIDQEGKDWADRPNAGEARNG